MANTPILKPIIILCLITTFALTGCSGEDEPVEEVKVAEKAAVESKKTATPKRTAYKKDNPDSLYTRSIREKTRQGGGTNYRKEYIAGLDALRTEKYDQASERFTKAISLRNEEQLVVRFTGMRVGSYLPHYHLGMIAFLEGDCVIAMNHWNTSMRQGVIQKAPENELLQEALYTCRSGD